MIDELANRRVVAHHKAVESPLIAKNIGKQETVGAGRHSIERVECRHDGGRACLHRGFVRRQINAAQRVLGHVCRVVVATGFSGAVGGEVSRSQRTG